MKKIKMSVDAGHELANALYLPSIWPLTPKRCGKESKKAVMVKDKKTILKREGFFFKNAYFKKFKTIISTTKSISEKYCVDSTNVQ